MSEYPRNGRFGKKQFSRPHGQMYPATCAQCGKATEVPFRPDGQRPIYCRDCFGGKPHTPAVSVPTAGRDFRKSPLRAPLAVPAQVAKPDPRIDTILKDIAKLQNTVNQILLGLVVSKAQAGIEASAVAPAKKSASKAAPKKKKK